MSWLVQATQDFTTYRNIPIVLLVPDDTIVSSDTLATSKIDEILVGSITHAELLARVRSMVRIRQQYDELNAPSRCAWRSPT